MEEMILRWVERVGFPIVVALLAIWAMVWLFRRRETERGSDLTMLHNALLTNTNAMDANSVETKIASGMMKSVANSLDSLTDKQTDLCKAAAHASPCEAKKLAEVLAEDKLLHTAELVNARLTHAAEEASAKLLIAAEQAAAKLQMAVGKEAIPGH